MNLLVLKDWAGAIIPYLAFFTAFWAILTYRRGKKVEVARLQKQIFDDLFLSGKFTEIRVALDLDFEETLAPALHRVSTAKAPLPASDRQLLTELDNFLNLIEYVLYLEQDKKLMTSGDRQALLSYWIKLVGKEPSLRAYVKEYDYERLHACLAAEECHG